MFLVKVCNALSEHSVKYALAGGYAVSLHGAVRGTFDIDLIIGFSQSQFTKLEQALESIGLRSRLPVTAQEVFSFRKEYIEKRNLIAWSFNNPNNPAELVDVVLTHDLKKMSTKVFEVSGSRISVLAKKDLIAMKRKSGRAQDLADIEALDKV